MKTIIVGYDGSDAAERALVRAADIAQAFSARLFVVSVSGLATVPATSAFAPTAELVPPAVAGPVAPGGTVPLPTPEPARPEPEELARRQLERARISLASRKIETEYVVELGDPAERLLDVADQRDADLIVVGSRERGFLERLLGRSVDEAVARRSERDVLLVHQHPWEPVSRRIAGVAIGLNWSWLVVFALLVWTLATGIFPSTNPRLSGGAHLAMAFVATALFFCSLLLHEHGHALRARREGIAIEGITLWLFGGVAKLKGMFRSAGAEFRVAVRRRSLAEAQNPGSGSAAKAAKPSSGLERRPPP